MVHTRLLIVLLGLGSLSSGKVIEVAGPAKGASYEDEPGGLSEKRLGFYPRFGEFGEMSMKEPAFKSPSKMMRPRQLSDIEADCNPGSHSCAGLGQSGCCANTHYCFVDSTGTGMCCPLGVQCNQDPCPTSSYFCTATKTMFSTITTAPYSGSGTMITTTTTGCCLRACLLSYHSCASSFGGNCCGNESACIPNNKCTKTPGPSTTTPYVGPNLCSTSSFACSDGGCCPNGSQCTLSSGVLGCATGGSGIGSRTIFGAPPATGGATVTPTNSGTGGQAYSQNGGGTSSNNNNSGGLSTGAKVGLGVGLSIGALALIGVGLLFARKGKKNKEDNAGGIGTTNPQPPPPPPGYEPPQSPFSPPMQQQPYYSPNLMPQQYQTYPPTTDQGYYAPQSPSTKPSPHQRPVSEMGGSSYVPPPQQPSQHQPQELQG